MRKPQRLYKGNNKINFINILPVAYRYYRKLPADKFIRIHRSFTIAVDKVDVIEGNCVEIGSKLIPISREHRQVVLKKIYK